jgi:hypothetical protein
MFGFLFLSDSDSFRHPRQFPPSAFDPALGLLLLRAIHFEHGFAEPPAGALQDGERHLQIALDLFDCRRLGCRWLSLRFQKQFRLGENAFANHARTFPPSRIELPGLPRVATVLDESGRHALTMPGIHAGHRRQILHGHLRRDLAFAHLPLDRFGQ